jgi:hypothetical protein
VSCAWSDVRGGCCVPLVQNWVGRRGQRLRLSGVSHSGSSSLRWGFPRALDDVSRSQPMGWGGGAGRLRWTWASGQKLGLFCEEFLKIRARVFIPSKNLLLLRRPRSGGSWFEASLDKIVCKTLS